MRSGVSNVLVCGAGQLGSRYLQGLASCSAPLRIFVQDPSAQSLEQAEQRWHEAATAGPSHEAVFISTVEALPPTIDVAIVATTANVRPGAVDGIARHSTVRYWVMEKVLAQSGSGLDQLVARTAGSSGAWVNTPRRMMPWHKEIKSLLGVERPLTLNVNGGAWGLACNAVHFLDLCAWWTDETLIGVKTDHLCPQWFESKRPGFWEVFGTMEARFSGGSQVCMHAQDDAQAPVLEVHDGLHSWRIEEAAGHASRSDGIEVRGRMPYQSEMSSTLVESILDAGRCELPTLSESVALHRVYLAEMLEHWTRAGHPGATLVPIT